MAPSEISAGSTAAVAMRQKKQASRPTSDDDSTSVAGSVNGTPKKRKRTKEERAARRAAKNGTAAATATKPVSSKDGERFPANEEEEEAAAEIAASKRPRIDLEDKSKSLALTAGHPRAPDAAADAERLEKMCGAVRTILECIGEDSSRPGLLDTPSRYAKALLFLTKGYQQTPREIINDAIWDDEGHNHHGMVIVRDIEIYSLCEHHMVPFTGKMHIGYIPTTRVVGLSKLARIAEVYARRLQIQERLTKEVAMAIMDLLKPHGVAVVMEAKHLCMVTRGVEKTGTSTITSSVLGCFERSSKTRNEFLSLLKLDKSF
ncbi:related to GTP cyclohydrolase 1 [Cephalotrichum gorgonifer]|uniref:GTP cyclohydrolase 1 n=1 Tax=Cephalotrichum gorgonifer TaxID=2041049 RepID=A0AAE8MSK8_9PEZI|nr:related to GTP cyclohydrolase 1 [Cephalotrichum gorgonifer]